MTAHAHTYDAFISYRSSRRLDRDVAEHLQQTLETYRVPPALRHALARPRNRWLSSRLRVFRDNSDLGATPDLWKVLRNELLQSRWLIVVCSPATPRSSWVEQEIAAFIEAKGREHVIAVLVEGEPEVSIPTLLWSETVEGDGPEARTRRVVPRAADVRGVGDHDAAALLDGWRTPKSRQKRFDVLAPILGLASRDHLVRRHRARGRQTMALLTFAACVAVAGGVRIKDRFDAVKAEARTAEVGQQQATASAEVTRLVADRTQQQLRANEKVLTDTRGQLAEARTVADSAREDWAEESARGHLRRADEFKLRAPFEAAAEVYRSRQLFPLPEAESELAEKHAILVQRRTALFDGRRLVRPGPFSYVSQSTGGARHLSVSDDGGKAIGLRQSRGSEYSPQFPGEALVLDFVTTKSVPLTACDTQTPDRLEFAAFVGNDRVLLARGFYLDLYTVAGDCLGRIQLQHTITPVTAAGGMLRNGFFVAGNGAGCVWLEKFEGRRLSPPAPELGANEDCDTKRSPDAVVQVLTSTAGEYGILLFQSGRLDAFGLDGPAGRPRRRPVVPRGGIAAAFQPNRVPSTFAVSYSGKGDIDSALELWSAAGKKASRLRGFSLADVEHPVDYLGFSSDGQLLMGVDRSCALHYWNAESGDHLLKRSFGEPGCAEGDREE